MNIQCETVANYPQCLLRERKLGIFFIEHAKSTTSRMRAGGTGENYLPQGKQRPPLADYEEIFFLRNDEFFSQTFDFRLHGLGKVVN